MEKSLAIVIAALKNKKKISLAEQLTEALGIDFDVSTDIEDDEFSQELKNVTKYIPTESNVNKAIADLSDVTIDNNTKLNMLADLFIDNKNVTSSTVEDLAEKSDLPVSEIIDTMCEVIQTLWKNDNCNKTTSQVDEGTDQEIVYTEDQVNSKLTLLSIEKSVNKNLIKYNLKYSDKSIELINDIDINNSQISNFEQSLIDDLKLKFNKYKKILEFKNTAQAN